ncbi:FAD-dependent oxidoreductase [Starkeya sp. ORNL1]|uniref:NAD(P)/FAD-dependent oxidoreductase n=1 Tax=Starkeya sp. ORNL1 TaxID=2709380 RepID=UPI00146317C7|nr:FAD-dependent oxidoreductase [Starkeya sp. ORNL1]QJP16655.1 FAD-dependent oxidoreductase [Starkeya sp. ORNL1]
MGSVDALVIGGGFFGCEIAVELRRLGFARVMLCEREAGLLRRASYVNQARVHNGYHYPRSLSTAERSRANFERFVADYGFAVRTDMVKLYAIAATSRVNAGQFASFCGKIGVLCREAPAALARLFDPDLIEAAFLTRELAFDAVALARSAAQRLADVHVDVRLGTPVRVEPIAAPARPVRVTLPSETIEAGLVVNCTYAALDDVGIPVKARLKRELAEMLLIPPPRDIADVGITVMDGPFFSTMPFPAAKLHSLSHVRYTPHEAWTEPGHGNALPTRSNAMAMLRDAARFLPVLAKVEPVRSIFEIKTVLLRNEDDDGRPILAETCVASPRILSVMGSKIDNIYDVLEMLRAHQWKESA